MCVDWCEDSVQGRGWDPLGRGVGEHPHTFVKSGQRSLDTWQWGMKGFLSGTGYRNPSSVR